MAKSVRRPKSRVRASKKATAARPKKRAAAAGGREVVTFEGLAIVRDGGTGVTETVILSSAEQARRSGLSREELAFAEVIFAGVLAGPRKCRAQTQGNQIRCIKLACPHPCHLWRHKIPIPADQFNPEDTGENDKEWVPKAKGFGYWCACDKWDDI